MMHRTRHKSVRPSVATGPLSAGVDVGTANGIAAQFHARTVRRMPHTYVDSLHRAAGDDEFAESTHCRESFHRRHTRE